MRSKLIDKLDDVISALESKLTFATDEPWDEPKVLVATYDSTEYANNFNTEDLGYWKSYGNQAYIKRYRVKGNVIKVRIIYFFEVKDKEELDYIKERERGASSFRIITPNQLREWTEKFRGAPEVRTSPWSM